jgi:hypothetical protein
MRSMLRARTAIFPVRARITPVGRKGYDPRMFEEGFPLLSHRWLVLAAVVTAVAMMIAGNGASVWYVNVAEEELVLVAAGGLAQMFALLIAGLLIVWRRGYMTSGILPAVALVLAAMAFVITVGEWMSAYRFGVDYEISSASYALAVVALIETAICAAILLRPREEISESNTDWEKSRLPRG